MDKNFNVNVYSDDVNFCSSLAIECNKYGFSLTFFENNNIKTILNNDNSIVSIIIIDLTNKKRDNPFSLGSKAREYSKSPVFGVVDFVDEQIRNKSRENGFDLIFTKKILLKSVKKVVIHISEQ